MDHLAIGRDVAVAGPVIVLSTDNIERDAQVPGNVFENRFNDQHPLRSAKAAEGRVRHCVGFAREALKPHVWQVVAIVAVAKGPSQDTDAEVGDVTRPHGHGDVDAIDTAVGIETNIIAEQEIMAFARDDHVIVTTKAQLDGLARFCRCQCRRCRDDRWLTFFAAKPAAHATHFDGNIIYGNT